MTTDSHSGLKEILLDKLYFWPDHTTFFGIENVAHLDLESKRGALFGRCDVNQFLAPCESQVAVMFDTYIDIKLERSDIHKIFFPVFFLMHAKHFKECLGEDWVWSGHRKYAVACTMSKPRYLRLISSCWLANHSSMVDFAYTQNWTADDGLPGVYELLQIGGLKDWSDTWGPKIVQLPEKTIDEFSNPTPSENFKMLYDAVYSEAAAAVVIGAVCWEQACEIDEKYLHAVYSGCIPLVQGYGIYDRLKDMGFDVFDDLIDTSSQYDANPITAIWDLWDRNLDFFSKSCAIQRDPSIQKRLKKNLDLAQDLASVCKNSAHNLNTPQSRKLLDCYKSDILQYFGIRDIDF